MSSGAANAVALLIYTAGLLPIAWMAYRPVRVRWVATIFGSLVLALTLAQTGIFNRDALASTDVAQLVPADTPASRCGQVFDVLAENGVLLEPPGPDGLIVRGDAWDQLPPPLTEAVVGCAQTVTGGAQVEVIRR